MIASNKPTFFVIGAAKSGTTSLYSLLNSHPQVFMPEKKEPKFFSNDTFFARGWEWYTSLFEGSENAIAVGDATPAYSSRTENPKTAGRIAEAVPEAKFIYIVRHPLKRIESLWRFMFPKNPEMDINAFVRHEPYNPWHLDRSRYWFQISAYRNFFSDDRILVIFFEEFKENSEHELKRCLEFIGVDPEIKIENPDKIYNKSLTSIVEDRSGYKKFQQSIAFKAMRAMIPKKIRDLLVRGSRLRKTIEIPPIQWDEKVYEWVVEQLKNDSMQFLQHYGKPGDYWKY